MYCETEGWEAIAESERSEMVEKLERLVSPVALRSDFSRLHRRRLGFWPLKTDGSPRRSWLIELVVKVDGDHASPAWRLLYTDMRAYFLLVELRADDVNGYEEKCFAVDWSGPQLLQTLCHRVRSERETPQPLLNPADRAACRDYLSLYCCLVAPGARARSFASIGTPYLMTVAAETSTVAPYRPRSGERKPVSRHEAEMPIAGLAASLRRAGPHSLLSHSLGIWIGRPGEFLPEFISGNPMSHPRFDFDKRPCCDSLEAVPPALPASEPRQTEDDASAFHVCMTLHDNDLDGEATSGECRLQLAVDATTGAVRQVGDKTRQPANGALSEWRVVWIERLAAATLVQLGPRVELEGPALAAALRQRESAGPAFPDGGTRPETILASEAACLNAVVLGPLDLTAGHWKLPLPAFVDTRFEGDLQLAGAHLAQRADFYRCHFIKRVLAPYTRFGGDVKFDECVFHGLVSLADGFEQRPLPTLDFTGTKVEGSLQILLSKIGGVVCMTGASIQHKLLVKGVLQVPRSHDAGRVALHQETVRQHEPIFAMFDLRHVKVGEAIDFGPARLARKYALFESDASSRHAARDADATVWNSLHWRRTQSCGRLRLDHARTGNLDLTGLRIADCSYVRVDADTPPQPISDGVCDMSHASVRGDCRLGTFVINSPPDDHGGAMAPLRFCFTATKLVAFGLKCKTLLLRGARVREDVALDGSAIDHLIADADGGYRLEVGARLLLSAAHLTSASLRGARIAAALEAHETQISSSLDLGPMTAKVLGKVAVAGDAVARTCNVLLRTIIGPNEAADAPCVALHNIRIGGDLTLTAIRVRGRCVINGQVTGNVEFWSGSAKRDLDQGALVGMQWMDGMDGVLLDALRWSLLQTWIEGSLTVKGMQIGGDLNLSNTKIGMPLQEPVFQDIDASDIDIQGDLSIRSWPEPSGDDPSEAFTTNCQSLDLRMARIHANCRLTGLATHTTKAIEDDDAPQNRVHLGAWSRFGRRLLGISPRDSKQGNGGDLEARGLTVGGDLELYWVRGVDVYQTDVAGRLDLSFVTARSVVLGGSGFQTEQLDITLANAKFGVLAIVPPFPAYIDMRGIAVAEFGTRDSEKLHELLDNSYPFDRSNYSQVEEWLRSSGDEEGADNIYRRMYEREWDEKVGLSVTPPLEYREWDRKAGLSSNIAPKRPAKTGARPGRSVWSEPTSSLLRNALLPIVLLGAVVNGLALTAGRQVLLELPLLSLSALVAAAIWERFKHEGIIMFRPPEHRGQARKAVFWLISGGVAVAIWRLYSDYFLVPVLWCAALICYLLAQIKVLDYDLTYGSGQRNLEKERLYPEVHVWTRCMKWLVRILLRPIGGSALLLLRLTTGYLTDSRALVVLIFVSYGVGISAFSVPENFRQSSPPPGDLARTAPSSSSVQTAPYWGKLSAALFTLVYVVPIASLFDVETLFGDKSFLALRNDPLRLPPWSGSAAGAERKPPGTLTKPSVEAPNTARGTYFALASRDRAGSLLGVVFGDMPAWFLEKRWDCQRVAGPLLPPSAAGGEKRVELCPGVSPVQFAQIISLINWVAWPLVLFGFAARLRKRKGLG